MQEAKQKKQQILDLSDWADYIPKVSLWKVGASLCIDKVGYVQSYPLITIIFVCRIFRHNRMVMIVVFSCVSLPNTLVEMYHSILIKNT